MIYLLLFAGLFMGWSLGTNDAANAFGTAVATRVISYRTAVIIISILVVIGAFIGFLITWIKHGRKLSADQLINMVQSVLDPDFHQV